jgi:hypothetical protein
MAIFVMNNAIESSQDMGTLCFKLTEMNKNGVFTWATLIMIIVGCALICLGAFRYDDVAGWGFGAVGIGFLAIAWVFNALKGRV